MPGFATQVRNGIELQVGQVAGIDVTLRVGNVSEAVYVNALCLDRLLAYGLPKS